MPPSLPPKAKPDAVKAIFTAWRDADPSPQTELAYSNGYQLLVAVVLSAQATDKSVNIATAPLFAKVTTPAQMVALGEEKLTAYIKSIGLFRTKAKNVIALSQQLLDIHQGEVPQTEAALTALPGVGRKTANVILNCLFGHPTIAVDTHVYRVSRRLGFFARHHAGCRGNGSPPPHSLRVPPARPSLADSPRPLHLSRPQPEMWHLSGRPVVPQSGKNHLNQSPAA